MHCAADLDITSLRLTDLSTLIRLEADYPSSWSERQWRDELAQSGGWQWAARSRQTGELLGYLCGRSMLDEAEIFKLAVVTGYRRQGVAGQLLAHACRELRGAGAKCCYLELHLSNRAAESLYAKMGFFPLGVRKDYYGPGENGLLMKKEL